MKQGPSSYLVYCTPLRNLYGVGEYLTLMGLSIYQLVSTVDCLNATRPLSSTMGATVVNILIAPATLVSSEEQWRQDFLPH